MGPFDAEIHPVIGDDTARINLANADRFATRLTDGGSNQRPSNSTDNLSSGT